MTQVTSVGCNEVAAPAVGQKRWGRRAQRLSAVGLAGLAVAGAVTVGLSLESYRRGVEAYERGDCEVAIAHLNRLVKISSIAASSFQEFMDRLQIKVSECESSLTELNQLSSLIASKPKGSNTTVET